MRVAVLRGLVAGAERAGHGRLFRGGRSAYRAFSRLGVVPGSSDSRELGGIEMPDGFLAGMSEWQARRGAERLGGLERDIGHGRAIASRYSAWLTAHDRTPAAEPSVATHSFLRYPLRVRDKAGFIAAAEKSGVDLGDLVRLAAAPDHHGARSMGLRPWVRTGGGSRLLGDRQPADRSAGCPIVTSPTSWHFSRRGSTAFGDRRPASRIGAGSPPRDACRGLRRHRHVP